MNIIKGNLFDSTNCLAYCVSKDFAMSAGIASTFNKLYGGKTELRNQHVGVGGVAWLYREKYIYYLVTKEYYWERPTYENLKLCIKNLYLLCKNHDVQKISIPKLGCGLDKLEWYLVEQILNEEMKEIKINVFWL